MPILFLRQIKDSFDGWWSNSIIVWVNVLLKRRDAGLSCLSKEILSEDEFGKELFYYKIVLPISVLSSHKGN